MNDWQEKHHEIIDNFLKSLNTETNQFILKGGTALLTCYGLDRFSEDIDLDARSNHNILSMIHRFSIHQNFNYRVGKDTDTVKRVFLDYGNPNHKLKIETSYRQKNIIEDSDVININGITVYSIDSLFQQKCDAYLGRERIRDLYDVCFIFENYRPQLSKSSIKQLQRAFTYKGIDEVDALVSEQKDVLIDGDELAYKFLSISEAIGLELGEASMHQQDRLKEAYQELLSQESIAYSNDEWER